MVANLDYILLAANIAAYALIVVALFLRKENTFPQYVTPEEAFAVLEKTLKRSYPSLKDGYTWQELLEKLKSARLEIGPIDWVDFDQVLRAYEAFRYGGVSYGKVDASTVLRVAQRLQRREKIAI